MNLDGKLATTLITHKGESKLLREWVAELGLNYDTVRMRYTRGTRGAKLFAPTRATPKAIDLQHFLGDELYARLEETADYLQISASAAARHILGEGLKKTIMQR